MRHVEYSIIRSMENSPSTAKIAGAAVLLTVSAAAAWYALSPRGGVTEVSYLTTGSGTEGAVLS